MASKAARSRVGPPRCRQSDLRVRRHEWRKAMPVVRTPAQTHTGTSTCACPVCLGLAQLERRRDYAGPLLPEAAPTAVLSCVLAKGGLHDRERRGGAVVGVLRVRGVRLVGLT